MQERSDCILLTQAQGEIKMENSAIDRISINDWSGRILLNDGAFGEQAFIREKWKLLEMKNEKNYMGFLFP